MSDQLSSLKNDITFWGKISNYWSNLGNKDEGQSEIIRETICKGCSAGAVNHVMHWTIGGIIWNSKIIKYLQNDTHQ